VEASLVLAFAAAAAAAAAAAVPSPGSAILPEESVSCGEVPGADSPMEEINPCLSNIPKSIDAEAGTEELEKHPPVED